MKEETDSDQFINTPVVDDLQLSVSVKR